MIFKRACLTRQALAGDDLSLKVFSSAIAINGSSTEDILISLIQLLKLVGGSANRFADGHPAGSVSITLFHRVATDGSSAISSWRIPAAGDGGGINLINPDGSLWFIGFSW